MNKRTIAYWTVTGLVAFAFLSGGVMDLAHAPNVMEGMRHLGYPTYFATILGFWKVAGALAIVAPKLGRVKEWAYAGMFFDLTGAAASHASMGDATGKVMTPVVLAGLLVASYLLRDARVTRDRRAIAPAA